METMNYQAVEEIIRADYSEVTPQYRRDDEIEVTTENHRRIRATLESLCNSFPHPIRALDVGCGTGRYFYCLKNTRELTGIDITDEMLRAAENPVRQEQISIKEIRLKRANAHLADFAAESFHLIYSLGMFGNGCPVTVEICDKFHDWLVPGGKLYFNTVDVAGLPLWTRVKKRARRMVFPLLLRRWRDALNEREARHPFFGASKRELEKILRKSRFTDFKIKSRVCESPLWTGRHLECITSKSH